MSNSLSVGILSHFLKRDGACFCQPPGDAAGLDPLRGHKSAVRMHEVRCEASNSQKENPFSSGLLDLGRVGLMGGPKSVSLRASIPSPSERACKPQQGVNPSSWPPLPPFSVHEILLEHSCTYGHTYYLRLWGHSGGTECCSTGVCL